MGSSYQLFRRVGSGAVYTWSKQVKYISMYWQSCCHVRFHKVANGSGLLCSKKLLPSPTMMDFSMSY
jgi:hypothetical protein